MKSTKLSLLLVLLLALGVILSACGSSPKAKADELAKYLPEEIASPDDPEMVYWERDDGETVKLLNSTISNKGHITMLYEGPDDALGYIVLEAQPSEDAAEVALATRIRELQLQGLTLDRDRQPGQATADVAQTDLVRYALFQEGNYVVEVNTIVEEDAEPVSDDAFDALLGAVRAALAAIED